MSVSRNAIFFCTHGGLLFVIVIACDIYCCDDHYNNYNNTKNYANLYNLGTRDSQAEGVQTPLTKMKS